MQFVVNDIVVPNNLIRPTIFHAVGIWPVFCKRNPMALYNPHDVSVTCSQLSQTSLRLIKYLAELPSATSSLGGWMQEITQIKVYLSVNFYWSSATATAH